MAFSEQLLSSENRDAHVVEDRVNETSDSRSGAPRPLASSSRLVRASATVVALTMGFAILFFRGLPCPVATLVHVPCPACGSTRSVRALLAFDFPRALHWNPVAPFVFLLLALLATRLVLVVARDGSTGRLAEGWTGRTLLRVLSLAVVLELVVWTARFFGFLGGPVSV